MTQTELIYDIRESFNIMSDDSDITNTYIAFLIDKARSVVLQQRYSDPRNIVPMVTYQSFTLPIGNYAKSTSAIPSVVKTTGIANSPLKVYGVGIANTNLEVPINVVNIDRLPYVGSNSITNSQIYCSIDEDGYVIFNSKNNAYKLIDSVFVRGIFENPKDAYALKGSASSFYNSKYPLSEADLLDVRKIVDKKLSDKLGTTKDNLNDGTSERLDQNPQGNK